MRDYEYQEMYQLESTYWWFVARRRLIEEQLRLNCGKGADAKVLDVGCGTGYNLEMLAQFGQVFGTDFSEHALEFCHRRGFQNVSLARAESLPFDADTFDVVTALDVLEHVDDDLSGLADIHRVTRPGGLLIVTVPAYGFLWSEHDEALQHRRRYSAHELRNKLTNAGFEVVRSTYFITLLFFPIFFMRIAQNLSKKSLEPKTSHVLLPRWANWLLVKLLDLERLYLRLLNLPLGVSIVCLARKPAAGG